MGMSEAADPMHVLVFTPVGRDARDAGAAVARVDRLGRLHLDGGLRAAIDEHAAAIILTEEVFDDSGFERLATSPRAQPPWSEIPRAFAGGEHGAASPRTIEILDMFANITELDRPSCRDQHHQGRDPRAVCSSSRATWSPRSKSRARGRRRRSRLKGSVSS